MFSPHIDYYIQSRSNFLRESITFTWGQRLACGLIEKGEKFLVETSAAISGPISQEFSLFSVPMAAVLPLSPQSLAYGSCSSPLSPLDFGEAGRY